MMSDAVKLPAVILLVLWLLPAAAAAQSVAGTADDAFLDAAAAVLFERARAAHAAADRSIHSYEAVVRQRLGLGIRAPLKDRTIYREESTTRVRWFRDGPPVVQLLAARRQHTGGVETPSGWSDLFGEGLFDPAGDRMYLGLGPRDDGWIMHPLGTGATTGYRYRSGDTLTLAFPDGRRVRVHELQILPRERTPQLLSGALWIEPESGALVQAVYRLARDFDLIRDAVGERRGTDRIPGFLTPIEFRVDVIVVEYSLWNFRHWLPRVMRIDGLVRAGAIRAPLGVEIAYDIHDVWSEGDSASAAFAADSVVQEWALAADHEVEARNRTNRRGGEVSYRELLPRDPDLLRTSAGLPPPIWRSAPEFISADEVRALERALDRLPTPPRAGLPLDIDAAIARLGDMRYNRVEGLSAAARLRVRSEPYTLGGVVRLGTADRVPNAELTAAFERGRHAIEVAGFHALQSVTDGRSLGFGSSFAALMFGRDDGDYFRATGVGVAIRPAELRRQSWRSEIELARHAAVTRNTHWSVPRMWDDARGFRETITAVAGTAVTGTLTFAPWWGSEPTGWQGGTELLLQGAAGDFDYARARLTLRGAAPLFAGARIGAEAAAGTAVGQPPIQRHWFLGGPSTLRGYAGGSAIGPEFARGRIEIARQYAGFGIAGFSDVGWAGERSAAYSRDALVSAGIGLSLVDGLVRLDLARALRTPTGWRVELYLDALL